MGSRVTSEDRDEALSGWVKMNTLVLGRSPTAAERRGFEAGWGFAVICCATSLRDEEE